MWSSNLHIVSRANSKSKFQCEEVQQIWCFECQVLGISLASLLIASTFWVRLWLWVINLWREFLVHVCGCSQSLVNRFAFASSSSPIVFWSSSQHLKPELAKMVLSWFEFQILMWGFCNDVVFWVSSINTYTWPYCSPKAMLWWSVGCRWLIRGFSRMCKHIVHVFHIWNWLSLQFFWFWS